MQDFCCLCERVDRDRQKLDSVEVVLENIKQCLIVGFGITIKKKKPGEAVNISDFEETGLGTVSWTTEEKEAWLKDPSMPNVTEFLKKYRAKKHGN